MTEGQKVGIRCDHRCKKINTNSGTCPVSWQRQPPYGSLPHHMPSIPLRRLCGDRCGSAAYNQHRPHADMGVVILNPQPTAVHTISFLRTRSWFTTSTMTPESATQVQGQGSNYYFNWSRWSHGSHACTLTKSQAHALRPIQSNR